jgi:hypothetical protein
MKTIRDLQKCMNCEWNLIMQVNPYFLLCETFFKKNSWNVRTLKFRVSEKNSELQFVMCIYICKVRYTFMIQSNLHYIFHNLKSISEEKRSNLESGPLKILCQHRTFLRVSLHKTWILYRMTQSLVAQHKLKGFNVGCTNLVARHKLSC